MEAKDYPDEEEKKEILEYLALRELSVIKVPQALLGNQVFGEIVGQQDQQELMEKKVQMDLKVKLVSQGQRVLMEIVEIVVVKDREEILVSWD